MNKLMTVLQSLKHFKLAKILCHLALMGTIFSSCHSPEKSDPVLSYDGNDVLSSDFSLADQIRIYQDEQRLYTTLKSVGAQYIIDRFLKEFAHKNKISVQEARTRLSPQRDSSEQSIREYYARIKDSIPYSYDQVKDELKQLMTDEYEDTTNDLILNLAVWSKNTRILFREPVAPVLTIPTDGFPYSGSAKPKITLVEYGDFTCPYCKKLAPILERLVKEYNSVLKVVWKYFFSHSGEIPEQIAVGGQCLLASGNFWKYHAYVFENQMDSLFKKPQEILQSAGITQPSDYNKCLEDKATLSFIRESHAEASEFGVKSTPTLFVNGRRYDVQLNYESIQKVIEVELSKLK